MLVGIPQGLLYWNYGDIIKAFLNELHIEFIESPRTNRNILDKGVNCCVDDACLPVKIFHGHVDWLKDKCDFIMAPRVMQLKKGEFICPKFCGITEMIKNSIDGLPPLPEEPLYALSEKQRYQWFLYIGELFGRKRRKIYEAYLKAMEENNKHILGFNEDNYEHKIALLGHPYNIYDTYCNMDVKKKFNKQGIGVITEDYVDSNLVDREVDRLFKKPFWTFARKNFGTAAVLYEQKQVDGFVYVSSFACGIDSVVIELVKEVIGTFPFMTLKIDEHTGEAGINTRIEAFSDMLKRRSANNGHKLSAFG